MGRGKLLADIRRLVSSKSNVPYQKHGNGTAVGPTFNGSRAKESGSFFYLVHYPLPGNKYRTCAGVLGGYV
jgi:hypothetical protein